MPPIKLFLEMWREAVGWSASQRRGLPVNSASSIKQISDIISIPDGEKVCESLLLLKNSLPDTSGGQYRALVLEILKQIDFAFAEVHPRNGRFRGVAKWVRLAHENRLDSGVYFSDDQSYVVA